MPFSLDLRLEERRDDRVFVTVLLCPDAVGDCVDGVAITLVGPGGDARSPRLVLPIVGALPGPTRTTVELRALEPLPEGCRVLAEAWSAEGQREVCCPADPWTDLESHVRGRACVSLAKRCRLAPLGDDERQALARAWPWLSRRTPAQPTHLDANDLSGAKGQGPTPQREAQHADVLSEVEAFCRAYDLGADDQALLEELLTEEVDR